MPDDSLAALGEIIRDQFTHQLNALGTGWDIPLHSDDWESLRALETDYLNLLQPVMEWLTLERWLTSGFLPETLPGSTPAPEDSPTSWDTVFEHLPAADIPFNLAEDISNLIPTQSSHPSSAPAHRSYSNNAQDRSRIFDPRPQEVSDSMPIDPPINQSPIPNLQSPFPPASFDDTPAESFPRTIPNRSPERSSADELQLKGQDADTLSLLSRSTQPLSYFENAHNDLTELKTSPAPPSSPSSPTHQPIIDRQSPITDQPISNLQSSPRIRRPILPPNQPTTLPISNTLPFTATFETILPVSEVGVRNRKSESRKQKAGIGNSQLPNYPVTQLPDQPITNHQSPITPLRGLQALAQTLTTSASGDWPDEWEEDGGDEVPGARLVQESDRDQRPAYLGNGNGRGRLTPRGVSLPDRERRPVQLSSSAQETESRQEPTPRSETASSQPDDFDSPVPQVDLDEIYEALVKEVKREYRRFYGV